MSFILAVCRQGIFSKSKIVFDVFPDSGKPFFPAAVGSLSCNDTHDIRAFIAERIKDGFKFISDGLIGNKDV